MPSKWRMWWQAAKQIRRQRPPLSLLVCSIAPLAQDRDGLESALLFAEAGLPVGFMSMVEHRFNRTGYDRRHVGHRGC